MNNMQDEQCDAKHPTVIRLNKMLEHDKDALHFMCLYFKYIHAIDDLIDEKDSTGDSVLNVQNIARNLFSLPFYQDNIHRLSLLDLLVSTVYRTSVDWQYSEIKWQRRHAHAIRHAGYLMSLAVVAIVCGEEAMKSISKDLMLYCHETHLKDEGEFE